MFFRRLFAGAVALAIAGISSAQSHLVDVVYGHKMGMALTMDIFTPAKSNHIAVVFIVSGGWVSSQSNINPGLAKIFTDRGMTVFEVCHGSQPKFQIPEIATDVLRSIRFVRTNASKYDIDPNKIGVSGASAGGHLSLMLGAYGSEGKADATDPIDRASSAVQAIACFFPPTDFLNWGAEGKSALDVPMLQVFYPAFGITKTTPKEEVTNLAKVLSPIYRVTPSYPPTLIFHGDADRLVPIQQSEIFMKKLQEAGVPHKFEIRKGKGHGYPEMVPDLIMCADWFSKYLGGK